MLSTGRLIPMPVGHISQTATWSHSLARCHLEREIIDFTPSQLRALGVHYQLEQQIRVQKQKIEHHLKGIDLCEVYGAKPQQFIYPGYFTKQRVDQYLQRRNSKKMYRRQRKQENYRIQFENAKKSVFEVHCALQRVQIQRRKEVTERQAAYVSQVLQDDEGMKVEIEIIVQSSWDSEGMQYWGPQERKGFVPFLMIVYWMSYRLLRALLSG
ncbi:uncharacterized protein MELLADRAFT_76185 [Melampsora larici-populina 98AG31]|uniref:Uncharacterized protein n=1 Tax=Melampsora larici-populina (strain 98AG31 / pathotype 3-4-7) TaxID=747676 RepID=F4S2G1_MELLP|nr:uncharacterized protein MELLADRAFT_75669 [Melampsora larici-populina 98AG31]XP_007419377.1 uncharacterized protein MELLADRAFT_76185 [Melampsora larici-populina 98AG31]EGF97350.1 hypothetical protein MELLADRAFT_76185 [Melampsora larici-populina 98AG31]EGG01169.1 hypothetical protein MELLADRAFT_75669 [Melampsora larici-populina 98AG31]